MIKFNYEIWTNLGWEMVENLSKTSKVMVLNINNRMSKFIEIGNIKTVFDDKNFKIGNNNYEFIFNKKINFINEKYAKFSIKDLFENDNKKIFIDSRTFFIPEMVNECNEKNKFITFDLRKDEFVLIKNVLNLYVNWDCENIEKEIIKKKRGRPKKGLDNGLSNSAKI